MPLLPEDFNVITMFQVSAYRRAEQWQLLPISPSWYCYWPFLSLCRKKRTERSRLTSRPSTQRTKTTWTTETCSRCCPSLTLRLTSCRNLEWIQRWQTNRQTETLWNLLHFLGHYNRYCYSILSYPSASGADGMCRLFRIWIRTSWDNTPPWRPSWWRLGYAAFTRQTLRSTTRYRHTTTATTTTTAGDTIGGIDCVISALYYRYQRLILS